MHHPFYHIIQHAVDTDSVTGTLFHGTYDISFNLDDLQTLLVDINIWRETLNKEQQRILKNALEPLVSDQMYRFNDVSKFFNVIAPFSWIIQDNINIFLPTITRCHKEHASFRIPDIFVIETLKEWPYVLDKHLQAVIVSHPDPWPLIAEHPNSSINNTFYNEWHKTHPFTLNSLLFGLHQRYRQPQNPEEESHLLFITDLALTDVFLYYAKNPTILLNEITLDF